MLAILILLFKCIDIFDIPLHMCNRITQEAFNLLTVGYLHV